MPRPTKNGRKVLLHAIHEVLRRDQRRKIWGVYGYPARDRNRTKPGYCGSKAVVSDAALPINPEHA